MSTIAGEELIKEEMHTRGSGVDPLVEFRRLNGDTQRIGYALAWLHESVVMSRFVELLAKARVRTAEERRFSFADVKEALQILCAKGLVSLEQGRSYRIDAEVSHLLVAQACQQPELLAQLRGLSPDEQESRTGFGNYWPYSRYADRENGLFRAVRDLREAYFDGDAGKLARVYRKVCDVLPNFCRWDFAFIAFDAKRLLELPTEIFGVVVKSGRTLMVERLAPLRKFREVLQQRATTWEEWRAAAEMALFQADWESAEDAERGCQRLGTPLAEVTGLEIQGGAAFLWGDDEAAISAFEESMALWRKATRKRKSCPEGLFGIWFMASLIRRGRPEDLAAAREYATRGMQMHEDWGRHFNALDELAGILSGRDMSKLQDELKRVAPDWLANPGPNLQDLWFFAIASLLLSRRSKAADWIAALERLRLRAERAGALWIAAEAAALAESWPADPTRAQHDTTVRLWETFGPEARPFTTAGKPPAAWELVVMGLETLSYEFAGKGSKATTTKRGVQKQLIWCLIVQGGGWLLQPIERSISANGSVSKGRRVALKRLKEKSGEMLHLTDQDRRVAARIHKDQSWGYQEYELADPRALLELAGHPLIFSDAEANRPLELVKVSPRLVVTDAAEGSLALTLTPASDYRRAVPELIRESPTRFLILDRQKVHVRLAEILNQGKVEIPGAAKERIVAALGSLAEQVAIESDEDTLGEVGIETVEAEPRPVLRLVPHGAGLHARLFVRPLPEAELTCDPGEGKAMVMARRNGRQVQARRNLKREQEGAAAVLEACPTFADLAARQEGRWSALLESPFESLSLLEELRALESGELTVEWPEGQPFRLRSVAQSGGFEMSLGGSKDWLTASGKLTIDDDLVLNMRQLLELLGQSADTPGFVRLQEGQFLALTKEFRRQLEDLRALSQPGRGEELRIHPLAALALEGLTEDPAVKTGAAWKKQLARIRTGAAAEPPEPPSTLQAELRPYQLEGYRWLRRLADWGMGACLADDMGLGKTVQALALLLDRAPDGPALVVAPTSVAANWLEETTRFAPTLRPILFGRTGDDRGTTLKNAGPFDLIITSYGLLQSEAKSFVAVRWHTLILDEAQAIKNRVTKRSQAVMKLDADFRLITTGTPVENRLAELHNLFQFLNPGLLGSWDRFRKGFADPIERGEDREARDRLRRLIRPFILRRLKSEVLRDLPSRTEIALQVELSAEEAAFYEALRRKAVEDLEKAKDGDAGTGQAAIRILAELTRLRRACCHPKLIDPKTPLEGSKLQVFGETLEEILGGNHKVLVFSQFVDHLHLIRALLEERKIRYQYLDGSTPAAKRQAAVRDFQSGKGDVFLISLKAGGFGLNLTAADYVIHMDPWWNPAAEDQASDRAHRIGQTRPVTIYRLITTGTIEEKIVELHHRKRELADSILEGADSAGRLTPEELLELLRGEG